MYYCGQKDSKFCELKWSQTAAKVLRSRENHVENKNFLGGGGGGMPPNPPTHGVKGVRRRNETLELTKYRLCRSIMPDISNEFHWCEPIYCCTVITVVYIFLT